MRFLGLLAILGACGLFAVPRTAAADQWWYYVTVACDPQKQRAEFGFGTLTNEEPTSAFIGDLAATAVPNAPQAFRLTGDTPAGECHLTPDLTIRAKVGEDDPRAYGQCGADPAVWLSLWVDRRKWLSAFQVGGHCASEVLQEITVTPAGLRICMVAADIHGDPAGAPACEERRADQLAQAPDLKEFPDRPNAPVQGSVVLAYAEDAALCGGMIAPQTNDYGLSNWRVVLPHPLDRKLVFARRNVFDIDNDGALDVVYSEHPTNGANDADIYYAWPGSTEEDAEDTPGPDPLDYSAYRSSRYAFPYSLGTCGDQRCGADEERPEEGRITLMHEKDNAGAPLSLRFRYLHEDPFLWKGQTYFVMRPLDAPEVIAVLRPHPTGFDETCIFHKIQHNY
jgi:hypothetical protein